MQATLGRSGWDDIQKSELGFEVIRNRNGMG